ncbi:hypothetical protein V5O48_002530 [Marasmius crinis-equi]|uniref:Uncharacterized protein n=1 Tax=Marasmius crinis-equi TaxID=585013 RepID=A0ABR3FVE1_9AGAR
MLRSAARRPRCHPSRVFRKPSLQCNLHARTTTHLISQSLPRLLTRHTCFRDHRDWTRTFSTSSPSKNASEEIASEEEDLPDAFLSKPRSLSVEEAWAVIKRSQEVWPALQGLEDVADVWSQDWAQWDDLFTLYWHSSHYLMIPAIEMFVNLQHGIEGETRPLLYSTPLPDEEWQAVAKEIGADPNTSQNKYLLFTIVGKDDSVVYIGNLDTQHILQLFHGDKPVTVDTLVPLLSDTKNIQYTPIPRSPEGCKLLDRIFARDPTVREELGEERWLGLVPPETQPWQEWTALPENGDEDLEFEAMEDEEMKELEEEAEALAVGTREGAEASKEAEDAQTFAEPRTVKLSEQELTVLEEARKIGLTKDMDEVDEMMKEAEEEIGRTVQRFEEVVAEMADPSSSPSSPSSATEFKSSFADDSMADDPDAVSRAVEHIIGSRGNNALSIAHLRHLSVEQLAEVQERLEAIYAELEDTEHAAASAWKTNGSEGLETSQPRDEGEEDDDRIRVRLPYKNPQGDSDGPKDNA